MIITETYTQGIIYYVQKARFARSSIGHPEADTERKRKMDTQDQVHEHECVDKLRAAPQKLKDSI